MSKSIYETIGGGPTVCVVVAMFYEKILGDKAINGFFDNVDMAKQCEKQYNFLSMALGGPNNYKGKNMMDGFKHLGLKEADFNAIVGHLVATLKQLGVEGEIFDNIMGAVVALKDEVLNV